MLLTLMFMFSTAPAEAVPVSALGNAHPGGELRSMVRNFARKVNFADVQRRSLRASHRSGLLPADQGTGGESPRARDVRDVVLGMAPPQLSQGQRMLRWVMSRQARHETLQPVRAALRDAH